jgi:hypothetical protein
MLGIARLSASVTVWWDRSVTGFVLEQATPLSFPMRWKAVSGVAQNSVTIVLSPTNQVFRLHRP